MSHERWHVIEKIQVQVAAAGALAFMYFIGWQALRPTDVDGALVFLPTSSVDSLLLFAGIVWFLAAAVAVLTVSARLEGAVLALLIGVAGGSMRTGPMRLLVNRFEGSLTSLMLPLALEIVVLAVILVVATGVIALVRKGLHLLLPEWMHPARLKAAGAEPTGPRAEQRRAKRAEVTQRSWGQLLLALMLGFGIVRTDAKAYLLGFRSVTGRKGRQTGAELTGSILASFGLTLVAGLLLMMVTLRATGSTDRGQIVFSLAISFFLAAWIVSYFFPAGFSAPYWLAPLVLAIAIYIKSCWIAPAVPLTFSQIGALANILPVDWLAAGCGGAVGGYWLSCRLHEMKHFEDAKAA